jgi:hypothetical protein
MLILVFVFLVSDVLTPPLVTIEGVHWARDGPEFAYRVDGCDASYIAKYNLVRHLWAHHKVVMETGKLDTYLLGRRPQGFKSMWP